MLKLEFTAETPEALATDIAEYLASMSTFAVDSASKPDADDDIPFDTADANASGGVVQPIVQPVVVTLGVDAAGTPWDARIHTSNKGQKANGEWKRKPGLDNAVYDKIFAEVTATEQVAQVAGAGLVAAQQVADAATATAPVATNVAPATTGGPDMNDIQAKSAALIMAIAPPVGPLVLNKILTQFGAVAPNTVQGQPAFPTVAALVLDKFPAFIQTCDAVIGNATGINAENFESMVEVLIVRTA